MSSSDNNIKMAGIPPAGSAVALLRFDHERVAFLFVDYEGATTAEDKRAIVDKIIAEWTLHTQLEHEIFYPAAMEALDDPDLVSNFGAEHLAIDALISAVRDGDQGSASFEANVRVLGKLIKSHAKEEQGQLFQRVKASSIDLFALGGQLMKRKRELLTERTADVPTVAD